jgi:dTDP-4-amino-4,6-dideoxygalactose transaminase
MIPFAPPDITDAEIDAVTQCLRSGWLTTGPNAKALEQQFADVIGAKHARAVGSATLGALLLFDALQVGPGDEVVFPTWTFSGPAMMAHKLGAKVVLTDVDNDYMMTPDTLLPALTHRTKLVVPTHFAGKSADIAALSQVISLDWIVDDAAHAFPTHDASGKVGNQGTAASFFSFYATKTMTTGEGGMITTHSDDLVQRIDRLRCHGISHDVFDRYSNIDQSWRYDVAYPGWKANLPDVLAAIGRVQLRRSQEMLTRRTAIARYYDEAFRALELIGALLRPSCSPGHARHLYPLRITSPTVTRDQFIDRMRKRGVLCSMHFVPLHQHTFWAKTLAGTDQAFPNADRLALQEVSLPIYSTMTQDDLNRVVDAVLEVLSG